MGGKSNSKKSSSKSGSKAAVPNGAGTTWADRWQAHGTVASAVVAVLALLLSIAAFALQLISTLDTFDSQDREYSSRVTWMTLNNKGDVRIENRSTVPLQWVQLQISHVFGPASVEPFLDNPSVAPGAVVIQGVPPCKSVTVKADPTVRRAVSAASAVSRIRGGPSADMSGLGNYLAAFDAMTFSDPHGRWKVVENGSAESQEDERIIGVPFNLTDNSFEMTTGDVSDCGKS